MIVFRESMTKRKALNLAWPTALKTQRSWRDVSQTRVKKINLLRVNAHLKIFKYVSFAFMCTLWVYAVVYTRNVSKHLLRSLYREVLPFSQSAPRQRSLQKNTRKRWNETDYHNVLGVTDRQSKINSRVLTPDSERGACLSRGWRHSPYGTGIWQLCNIHSSANTKSTEEDFVP